MNLDKAFLSMAKWKRITLVVVAAVFVIRIGYIAFRGEVDREYYTSEQYDLENVKTVPCQELSQVFVSKSNWGVFGREKLDSLEFCFMNIADDKAGAIIIGIYAGDDLIYQTNLTLKDVNNWEWKRVFVNADLKENTEYKVTINANEECTKIPDVLEVDSGYGSQIIGSYAGNNLLSGNIAMKYGYLRMAGRADRAVMISLWLIFYGAIFVLISRAEKIAGSILKIKELIAERGDFKIFLCATEVLIAMLIIHVSGVEFQELTKVILYCVSLIAAVNFENKHEYVRSIAPCGWQRALVVVLYFYAAFALVGQRIFIYPLTLKITTQGLFVYLSTVIWFIPIIDSLLYYLNVAARYSFQEDRKISTVKFWLINIAVLVLPAAYNLFANNPGISNTDTYICMVTNAQHLRGMRDWHPAFYCMVLRAIQNVWNSTYAVIAVQYFFWTYVMMEFILFLRKKGLSDAVIIAAAVFCGFNASNFMYINTIWKDIPYTFSLLWAFIITAKLSLDFEEYKGKWYIYLELITSLVGIYLYRKNGVVSFAVIAGILLLVLRKNRKLIVSILISIALIGIVKGPVYSWFEVKDTGLHGIYHGLGQDILGAYYAGGEVSDDTLQMITMMTGRNNAEYLYTPTWSRQAYDVNVKPAKFIGNYIDTFLKNPIAMLRAVIDREDALWDIYKGQDSELGCVSDVGTLDGSKDWNDFYDERIYRSLYEGMLAATDYTSGAQWPGAIEWRCGLFCLLGLLCLVMLMLKSGFDKYFVITAVPFGQIMSLLLTTGWSDFRYFWSMNLINFCLIFITLVIIRQKENQSLVKENVL